PLVRLSFSPAFFYCSRCHRDLHSFPTRRSSDLEARLAVFQRLALGGGVGVYRHGNIKEHRLEQTGKQWQVFAVGKQFGEQTIQVDRKSTRLNSSHVKISYAVFCLKKKKPNRAIA